MAKALKTWSAIGIAVMSGAAHAAPLLPLHPIHSTSIILADGEGGEAAQGGESGGEAPATYALGSTAANAYAYDGKAVVGNYAAHVLKSYQAAKSDAQTLQAAVEAFLAAPSEATLKAAREAWVKARPAYLATEAFRFYDGPIEAIEGEINAWPLNEAYIDYVEGKPDAGLINDGTTILDKETLEGLNQKSDEADVTVGWHAIEFLLWGQDLSATGPGNRPYTDYLAGQGSNDRRRAYLGFVTSQLVKELDELVEAWSPDTKDSYAQKFLALDQREALGRVVNGMAILTGFELMSQRMGQALTSGRPEEEQSGFSDTTRQDFVSDLDGISRVWRDTGLDKLVASRDQATASAVTASLSDAEAAIAALGDPWDQVLASPKGSSARRDAEKAMQSLQNLADALKAAGNRLGVLVLIPSG
jgi:putative iron-regulated protein